MPVNLMSYPSYPKNALLRVAKFYPVETFFAILATVVTLLLVCRLTPTVHQGQPQPAHGIVSGKFPYVFYESTGPNQYILFSGQEKDIDFDRARSNSMAFHSLFALKWNVLYRNSSDGKITLIGTYDRATGNFVLRDWRIRAPFERIVVADEDGFPENQKIVMTPHLRRSDFETSPEFDPNSARFNPRLYEKGR